MLLEYFNFRSKRRPRSWTQNIILNKTVSNLPVFIVFFITGIGAAGNELFLLSPFPPFRRFRRRHLVFPFLRSFIITIMFMTTNYFYWRFTSLFVDILAFFFLVLRFWATRKDLSTSSSTLLRRNGRHQVWRPLWTFSSNSNIDLSLCNVRVLRQRLRRLFLVVRFKTHGFGFVDPLVNARFSKTRTEI